MGDELPIELTNPLSNVLVKTAVHCRRRRRSTRSVDGVQRHERLIPGQTNGTSSRRTRDRHVQFRNVELDPARHGREARRVPEDRLVDVAHALLPVSSVRLRRNCWQGARYRSRYSKPSTPRHEPSRDVANRRESEGSAATVGDDSRRAIAKPLTPRAAFVVVLAEHLKVLALVGDVEAARVAWDAIGRVLGSPSAAGSVVDLAVARRRP